MNFFIRIKLATFGRVRDYMRAFPFTQPAEATVQARLEDRIARAETLAAQQHSGRAGFRAAAARRAEVRRTMQAYALPLLARVAEAASREVPGLETLFQPPRANGSSLAFRTVARTMVEEAQARRDLFLRYGMPETLLDDLTGALDQHDDAESEANAGRRAQVGASGDLEAVTGEIMQLLQQLDAMNRYRFQKEPERLVAWESARNVPWPTGRDGSQPPTDPSTVSKS